MHKKETATLEQIKETVDRWAAHAGFPEELIAEAKATSESLAALCGEADAPQEPEKHEHAKPKARR